MKFSRTNSAHTTFHHYNATEMQVSQGKGSVPQAIINGPILGYDQLIKDQNDVKREGERVVGMNAVPSATKLEQSLRRAGISNEKGDEKVDEAKQGVSQGPAG